MPKFAIASDADQIKLGEGRAASDGFDDAPYRAAVEQLKGLMVRDTGFSKWARVEMTTGDVAKTERRRFSSAARKLDAWLGYAPDDKNPEKVLWFRVRPAPKARAKKTDAAAAPASAPAVVPAPLVERVA